MHAAAVAPLLCLSCPERAEGPAAPLSGAEEEEIKAGSAGHSFRPSVRHLLSDTGGVGRWSP